MMNTMHTVNMVDHRQWCQVMSPLPCVQEADILQVEVDITGGAVVKCRRNKKGVWRQKVEDGLWLASACFILFYGDFRSNFFSLLASDTRIRRAPLVYGVACLLLDCCIMLLFLAASCYSPPRKDNHAAAFTMFAFLGVAAFAMLSIALWPVWYILTIPLLFTLFMALVVLMSYVVSWSVDAANASKDSRPLAYYLCITS